MMCTMAYSLHAEAAIFTMLLYDIFAYSCYACVLLYTHCYCCYRSMMHLCIAYSFVLLLYYCYAMAYSLLLLMLLYIAFNIALLMHVLLVCIA